MLFDVDILVLLTVFYDLALTNVTVCCIWKWFLQHSIFEQCGKILCFLIIEEIWWENFNKVNLNTVDVFSSDLFSENRHVHLFQLLLMNGLFWINWINQSSRGSLLIHVLFAVTLCPPSRNVRYCMKKSSQFVRASRKARFFFENK